MQTAAGVFRSSEAARDAAKQLLRAGFSSDQVTLLSPGEATRRVHPVPESDMEQPGVGSAIGGVVGAAVGIAGGLELGLGVTALIPGVGPVFAAGVLGAAILGAGGFFAGAGLGALGEEKDTQGLPADEIFFYKDALRQGRSVVVVLTGDEEVHHAREILSQAGAESIDAARDAWWIGLRGAEAEHYRALGHNFEQDQDVYRAGFEAALRRECRAKSVDEAADCLKWWYPDIWDTQPFRHGYARGRVYVEAQERTPQHVN